MTSDEIRREIERCDREIENAIAAQRIAKEDGDRASLDLTVIYEMDWLVTRLGLEEDLELAIARDAAEERRAA